MLLCLIVLFVEQNKLMTNVRDYVRHFVRYERKVRMLQLQIIFCTLCGFCTGQQFDAPCV